MHACLTSSVHKSVHVSDVNGAENVVEIRGQLRNLI